MSVYGGPKVITNNLYLHLDAANTKSYPGSGTIWYDLSGNGINVTLTNGPTFDSTNMGSILFDGSNDYGSASLSVSLSSMTLEITFNVENGAFNWNNIAVLDTGSAEIMLEYGGFNGSPLTNGYLRYYNVNESDTLASASQYIGDFRKHVACLSVGNSVITSYFDGVLQGSSALTTSNLNFNRLTLGNDLYRGSRPLKCRIYQVKIYNRGLSSEEVYSNYLATRNRFGI